MNGLAEEGTLDGDRLKTFLWLIFQRLLHIFFHIVVELEIGKLNYKSITTVF